MTTAVGGIRFDIWAVDKTQQAFNAVKGQLAGIKKQANALGQQFTGLKGAIIGAFSAGTFANIAKTADKVSDLSTRLGLSTEVLSQYLWVADATGVAFDTLAKGIQVATKTISEGAATGTGPAAEALKELGLNIKMVNQLSGDQKFEVIAEAMKEVKNQADKVRLATKLFGEEGVQLLQTMDGGAAAIRKLRNEADELGLTLNKTQADAIAEMNDSFGRLGKAVTGLAQKLIALLAPAIEVIVRLFTRLVVMLNDVGTFLGKVMDGVVDAFAVVEAKAAHMLGILDDKQYAKVLAEAKKEYGELAESIKTGKPLAEVMDFDAEKTIGGMRVAKQTMAEMKKEEEELNRLKQEAKKLIEEIQTPQEKFIQQQALINSLYDHHLITLDQHNRAMEKAKEVLAGYKDLNEEARRVIEELKTPQEKFNDELTLLNTLLEKGKINYDQYNQAITKATDEMKKNGDMAKSTFDVLKDESAKAKQTIQESLVDTITGANNGWKDFKHTVGDVVKSIGKSLMNNSLDQIFGNGKAGGGGMFDLSSLFGGGGKGGASSGGGFFSSLTSMFSGGGSAGGGGFLSSIGSMFGGFFAEGGAVSPNKLHIVGENGPEAFIPRSAGTILPNSALAGSGNVTVNMNITAQDAPSFKRSQSQIIAETAAAMRRAQRDL